MSSSRTASAATLVAAALTAVAAPSAPAATRTYSSGVLAKALVDPGVTEHALKVRDAGPVSHVSVSLRLDHPDTSQLTVSLVSPSGRRIALVRRQGPGRDLGTGRGCDGQLSSFDDEYGADIAEAEPPFADGPYAAAEPLRRLYGERARGRWRLRIDDAEPGGRGVLRCWRLNLSRAVVESKLVRRGGVAAELSFVERAGSFERLRLRIRRAGATLLAAPLAAINCVSCPSEGLLLTGERPLAIRDLDADGEPEVLLDLYTGGAHCCEYSLIFRYRSGRRAYGRISHFWGNAGYRLTDHDRDRRPELSSLDDRFAYAFVPYAATAAPVQLWQYDRGRLRDVTRRFPAAVRRQADELWMRYVEERRGRHPEVRGILAAYLADAYLLGREDEAWRRIGAALRRGELGRGRTQAGFPAGRAYLGKLRLFMRRTGYAR
ncbi:MAG: proprotein convertase P-domain-containing protein [Gaiellaceae bacterium]